MKHFAVYITFSLTILTSACVSTQRAEVVPEPATQPAVASDSESADPATPPPLSLMARAIERGIDHGWRDFYLMSECHQESGFSAVEIFANGIGIWNRKQQFALSKDELRSILEAFRTADFAEMPEVFGRGTHAAPSKWQGDLPDGQGGIRVATRIKCRISLRVDTASKQVAQTTKGASSEPFQRLADRIFEVCREPALAGVTATDLNDGLDKIARGALAPEALRLTMNKKPHRDEVGEEGWLLRLRGPEVVTRAFIPRQGYVTPVRLTLDSAELSDLARLLADQNIGDLPINLYAKHYTTVKIETLGRKSQVEARSFDGMQPTQFGEQQKRFDLVVAELGRLHQRVIAEGEPDSLPSTR